MPLDSTVYMTDLDLANQRHTINSNTRPEWFLEYHPKKAYRLPDMSYTSWDAFIKETQTDLDLAYLYSNHYHRFSKEYATEHGQDITQTLKMLRNVKRYNPFLNVEKH